MTYVADVANARSLLGTLVGNGQCVTFIHAAVALPPASMWKQGARVKGNLTLRPGTVIAVFDPDGRYGNHLNGSSHAAIYLGQNASGIQVLDQWKGHLSTKPVHQRTMSFRHGHGLKVNDGDQFGVAE